MKLYLTLVDSEITLGDGENYQARAAWSGSQSGAASDRKSFIDRGAKRKDLSTHEIEVPTKKEELIAFLNLLASGESIVAATEKLLAK